MPKKRVSGKKVKKVGGKERPKRWILPVIVIFIVLAVIVILLQAYPIKWASSLEKAVEIVDKIDEEHNISFSDYKNGIYYLQSNPRYPNPFNFDEMDTVVREYKSVWGNEPVNLFIDFRSFLVEAEKYYRLSLKSSKGDLAKYGVSCSNRQYVLDSINNTQKSIEKLNLMLQSLGSLKQKYPDEFNFLNISNKWIKLMNTTAEDFQGEIDYKKDTWNRLCGNSTGFV